MSPCRRCRGANKNGIAIPDPRTARLNHEFPLREGGGLYCETGDGREEPFRKFKSRRGAVLRRFRPFRTPHPSARRGHPAGDPLFVPARRHATPVRYSCAEDAAAESGTYKPSAYGPFYRTWWHPAKVSRALNAARHRLRTNRWTATGRERHPAAGEVTAPGKTVVQSLLPAILT